ncbi:cupin domain-containing protein [Halobaculum rarum]|uniref:cupin domain-containing protein n=1 Tax=Halobaculum rarum TaxID=3075122 RepID=UPI0032B0166D
MLRRTVLKTGAATAALLATVVPGAAARSSATPATGSDAAQTGEPCQVDSPEGFTVEVLAGHATFPDRVAARFEVEYDESEMDSIVSDLPTDASSVLVAKVTWAPEGTSGWHTHPGPVVVTVVEGELDLINERDCVVRTYTAGEAFIDPGQGNVHIASNPSTSAEAVAYATFLGVPVGEPATVWVEPVDC